VADPEVLSRGGELRGNKWDGACAPPQKILNFKSKNGAFCTLLSIDFKVCRLIIETVSDLIRKTVTNRLFFSPFSEPQRQ